MARGQCRPNDGSGKDCLFIADISADTPIAERAIYAVFTPDPNNPTREPLTSERYPIAYELGEGEEAPNALSLAVHPYTGSLYIVAHEADEARIFEAAAPKATGDTLTFRLIGKIGLNRPTSADFSPNGAFLIVRNATNAIELKLEGNSITTASLESGVRMRLEQDLRGGSITYAALNTSHSASGRSDRDIVPFEVYTAGSTSAQPIWRYSYTEICTEPWRDYPPSKPADMGAADMGDDGDEGGCTSAGTAAPAALLWLLAPLWARIRRRKDTH
jgi:Synergist-CTERM protein sorting domain-containing protein